MGPTVAKLPMSAASNPASSMNPLTNVFDPAASPHINIATRSSPTHWAA